MKTAPAIALVVVGAGISGGMLEVLTPESDHLTMTFDEAIAGLATWLLIRFQVIARIISER